MKFTTRSIEALKPRKERYEVWEDNGKGFGIRVATSGRKSFIFMYRFDGKARRMTLGKFPKVSLAHAHRLHAQAREKLDHGVDPGTELIARRKGVAAAPTVQELVDEYMEKHAKKRKRSWKDDERILNKDVLAMMGWGKRKAKDITRRDIIQMLDKIVERGAPIQANRTFSVVRKMFKFAISRDIISASPCTAVVAPSVETPRNRCLSEEEVGTFWRSLDNAGLSEQTAIALRLTLAVAQRNGEIAGARKAEFDLDNAWWTIPGERSKNGLPHRVPLNQIALDLVRRAFDATKPKSDSVESETPFLFPSPRAGTHITTAALGRALQRVISSDGVKVDHFTVHDLRRTAASHMGSLGVSRLVIAKVLNHVERGITAIYDRHTYDAEKRQALDAWGRKLEGIISGKKANVITLTA